MLLMFTVRGAGPRYWAQSLPVSGDVTFSLSRNRADSDALKKIMFGEIDGPPRDGTATPGEQTFTFWKGYPVPIPLKGWDITKGPSGACGKNKQLGVQLPFTLTPVG